MLEDLLASVIHLGEIAILKNNFGTDDSIVEIPGQHVQRNAPDNGEYCHKHHETNYYIWKMKKPRLS